MNYVRLRVTELETTKMMIFFQYSTTVLNIVTARPKAQRCQVTPYVVNVLVLVVVGGGSDS